VNLAKRSRPGRPRVSNQDRTVEEEEKNGASIHGLILQVRPTPQIHPADEIFHSNQTAFVSSSNTGSATTCRLLPLWGLVNRRQR